MRQKWMKGMTALALGLLVAGVGFTAGVAPARAADATGAGETLVLKTQKDWMSYSVGVEMGRKLKAQGIETDPDVVARGVKDVMTKDKLLLSDKDIMDSLNTFTSYLRAKQGKDKLIAALDNRQEGEAFLAANKAKEGVVTLPSGLQYKILKAGTGRKPTDSDTVEYEYRGTLINGTEFDSSALAEKPAANKISDINLIAGLREALKLMPAGSKWQLFVPSQLAYLGRGNGRLIGPNATLIFEVELLGIEK